MNHNVLPSDRVALLAQFTPTIVVPPTAPIQTDWIDMGRVANLLAVISVGNMLLNATLDAKLQQATDAQGTGMKDVPGKAIAQFQESAGDADRIALVNLRADDLDVENGYTHARVEVAVATFNVIATVLLLGLDARYQPMPQHPVVIEVVG